MPEDDSLAVSAATSDEANVAHLVLVRNTRRSEAVEITFWKQRNIKATGRHTRWRCVAERVDFAKVCV